MTDPRVRLVAERYDRMARAYVRHWSPVIAPMAQPLVDAMRAASPESIVDVGCGTGALLTAWRAFASRVVGLDLSEGALREAGRQPVVAADANALPVRSDAVDAAVCVFALQHMPDPAITMHEMLRVARCVATVTWGSAVWPAEAAWQSVLDEHGAPEMKPAIANHALVDDEDKVRALLAGAGATEIRTWSTVASHTWTNEALWACLTEYGNAAERYAKLGERTRGRALEAGRDAVAALGASATTWRPTIVYAIGSRD